MRFVRWFAVGIVVLVAASFLATPGYAGFEGYWLQTTISESEMSMTGKSSEKTKQKVFYKPGMIKIVDLGEDEITIVRMDKELVWDIRVEDSTYTEMTFAQMEKMSEEGKKQMAAARVEMEQQMKDMSPEERAMVEKMMGSQMSKMLGGGDETGELILERTGKKEKISGHDCQQVVVTIDDDPFVEMWVTDEYELGGELFTIYEKMNLFKYKPSEDMNTFKSFPMKTIFTINMGMGTMRNVTTVSEVVKTSLKDSEFELPKGLRLEKDENMMIRPE
ncbi:MAG: hypothetical protein JSV84_07815 [Gemmatimonadota bacterium]|nr:MAG: hypothetical protein JSV84_07815 [Gemmatimonadota bacterium]